MVGLQTLDLAIGVRVPASQPKHFSDCKRAVSLEAINCRLGNLMLPIASGN